MTIRRLLIIDDDAAIGQTISLIARRAGLETMATHTPEAFFKALASFEPTCIAVDLVMPQMDGVELMEQLANRQCRARIIITSGLGSDVLDAVGRTARENGLAIAGVLSKPFTPAALRELLEVGAEDM
jgi:CheY-like chemotaxis protein